MHPGSPYQVLEGPPGWFAMHYTRETGAKVRSRRDARR